MSAISVDRKVGLLVEEALPARPWLITIAVMMGTFMEVLDTSVANVALPHIAGNLSASTDEATWVLTSYLVSNAIVLPATGWLSRVFGRKNFLMACMAIFTVASFLCGAATTLPMLILARVIQGAGGGALQPIAQSILLESFPVAKRGAAMAAYTLGIVFAPVIGPTIGGWITDNYSWRWVFYINIPVGIVAILMVRAFVFDPAHIRNFVRGKIDYIGFGLMALWISAFQVVLDKGQEADWLDSNWIRWLALISAVGFIAFVVWELSVAEPIVNLRVLKNRNLAVGTLLVTIVGVVLYGTTALIPMYLQNLLGYTALQSGTTVSPRGIGSILAILVVGRIVGKVDARFLISGGLALLAISSFQLGNISLDVTWMSITTPLILNGLAVSVLFIPLSVSTTSTLRLDEIGQATGLYNLMRNLGGAVGISLVTTLIARGSQYYQNLYAGHYDAYSPVYQQQYGQLTQGLGQVMDPTSAAGKANGMMYGELLKQSAQSAFVSDFRLLGFFCLACIPLVFLFKKGRKPSGPVEVH